MYASDEHVAIKATGDFIVLCPDWQKLAYAKDGAFASDDPWTLTSATVDFGAQGVKPDQLVLLTQPRSAFKGSGELLAIDSIAGGSATLRRIGQASGVGQPPGGAAGLTGVEFTVSTLGPQIEEASYSLNQRFNLDAALPGRDPLNMRDLRNLRQATVLTVLRDRYKAECRTDKGDFPIKLRATESDLADLMGQLVIRWTPTASGTGEETSFFSCRIVR